ncbi:beta-N-acetylhexosaminidase [Sinomicrobium sp. M5D2P9]
MKKNGITLILCMVLSFCKAAGEACPVIPLPREAVKGSGTFVMGEDTPVIISEPSLEGTADYFRSQVMRFTAISLSPGKEPGNIPVIRLELTEDNTPEEAYELHIDPEGIVVRASGVPGVFNGTMSLLQLIVNGGKVDSKVEIPGWEIRDDPQYSWRGLMLDVSRYFIPKKKILSLVDWMAFYKLNRLHLHLTDEPGWRIEIKKYPKLASVGGIGDHNDPAKPAQYFTQQDIAEIVDYAGKRNITVIPEIDMPGHATAANKAYPQYSGGGSEQHPEFTFDPGNGKTYGYLTAILREVHALFPSGMLHLGGDEVSFGNDKWMQNKGIRKLMARHRLKDVKEVEYYFMKRMADSVYAMGADLLAWDELAGTNLPANKTVMFWWRHDKPEQLHQALQQGYRTVICPRLPYYFDFVQDSTHDSGRKWGGKFNALADVYRFSVKDWTGGEDVEKILGVQANLWTETVTSIKRLDYLLFPRIAALSESAWTTDRNDLSFFMKRLEGHLELYQNEKIYYYNPIHPATTPEPVYTKKK